jgi:hypothetical protein
MVTVVLGFSSLWDSDTNPAVVGTASPVWPASTSLNSTPGKIRLVFALHPHCECSHASLKELELLLKLSGKKVESYILVLKPTGMPLEWVQSELYEEAREIHATVVITDLGGMESKKFGLEASGQVLLYDARGNLAFSGGITPAASQRGDCIGIQSIQAILSGELNYERLAPVYGCSLFD